MSTFWDAVGRAALGLPGTAAPRARSMFEPDSPTALLDLEPPLEDAETTANTPPAAEFPAAPAIEPTPAIRANEPVRQGWSAEGSDGEEEQDPRAPTESSNVAAGLNQAGPAVASSDERVTVPLPPLVTAERPERLHLETTLVVSEIIREPDARDVPSARVAAAPPPDTDRAEPSDADQQVAADDDEPEAVRPVALVAEPHAVAVEPPPLSPAPPEQPPLIVEIEHIEITIESERIAAPPPPARTARTAMPSLSDYLTGRTGSHP